MQLVRQDLLGTRVFVFTEPEGGGSTRILNLAKGATVADCMGQLKASPTTHMPLISGSPASLETELSNGDIISVVERAVPLGAEDEASELLPPASGRRG